MSFEEQLAGLPALSPISQIPSFLSDPRGERPEGADHRNAGLTGLARQLRLAALAPRRTREAIEAIGRLDK
jgi:hypothetical protein